ncbi:MAG: hypothetical protein WAM91_06820 [Candidatus Acidiferrales bacterium]
MTRVEMWVVAAALALFMFYFVIRFNSLWIYRLFDRALANKRDCIPPEYELPCYFRLDKQGKLNTNAKWPGWDGWYFFVIPDAAQVPMKMIRGSLMTGLYGLNGVDNYSMLPRGIGTFHAVELLTLTPTEEFPRPVIEDSHSKTNHLCHSYEPKPALHMDLKQLSVEISSALNGGRYTAEHPETPSGMIRGKWPAYQFSFRDSAAEIEFDLAYKGKDLIWWADIPGIFTYFAAFGEISGTMRCKLLAEGVSAKSEPRESTYQIRGSGAFEHGYARKPFNFDLLYLPVRAVQKIVPSFRPILYHYLLLIGDNDLHGGCMYARGFGIEFRNRGGLYVDGAYIEIEGIEIRYLESEEYRENDAARSRSSVRFPTRWTVSGKTPKGELELNMTRPWPPARIASNMIYYNHFFEGTFQGKKIRGTGYGEYLSI